MLFHILLFGLLIDAWGQESPSTDDGPPPINTNLLVDSLQFGELHTTIPTNWQSFEVKIGDWMPITCEIAAECEILNVFAYHDCETAPIHFTVRTTEGAKQYWQSVPCVSVPLFAPNFRGKSQKSFTVPRRKWR